MKRPECRLIEFGAKRFREALIAEGGGAFLLVKMRKVGGAIFSLSHVRDAQRGAFGRGCRAGRQLILEHC